MINIVKIGGNIINNPSRLEKFIKDLSRLEGPKILVHGGGREATELSARLDIETKMIHGRRITDEATLKVVTMTYAGLLNKRIVSLLQNNGCDAIGLTGADAATIPARRRNPHPIDYGFVGDINPGDINISIISSFLKEGLTPVFCALCYEPGGTLLNCNADSVASALAVAIGKIDKCRLTFCFEMPGVMADINNPESLIPLIDSSNFTELKNSGIISGGMLPKITNALAAVNEGVAEVRICEAENLLNRRGTIIK